MKITTRLVAFALTLLAPLCALADNPHVQLQTSLGSIEIELYADKAPVTVANFLNYVKSGQYNNTIFHRVIKGFVAQGGGYDGSLNLKATGAPIKNEADNGLKNLRGTIAMARTSDINSATDQFYFNLVDNGFLDHVDNTANGYGYAVFGNVVSGMSVVDAMATYPVMQYWYFDALPTSPITLQSATVLPTPTPFSASAVASGSISSLKLDVTVNPATTDVGKSAQIFAAAITTDGAIYMAVPGGWSMYNPNDPAILSSGNLSTQPQSFNLANGLNASSVKGATVFVGYGFGSTPSEALVELVKSQRLTAVYTIQ